MSVLAIYLQVVTPKNLGADSTWYHLPIAEHYATSGRIGPFAEGWFLGAYPHLASLLYTWAFTSPGKLFDHIALSSHLEFTLFLATLAGIAALTRRLLGGTRVPFAGAALFLFPAIYLYDASLNTGADHVLAFWIPALGLTLIRLGRRFDPAEATLAACMMAGALLTKHGGIYFVPPVGLFLIALAVRRRAVRPVLVFCGVCLVATAPHWLKNWIFYGDPEYPNLNAIFRDHPFHARAAAVAANAVYAPQFRPHGTLLERTGQTLQALVNFGLVPHDWNFHRDRPVVGALFTLLLPVLAIVRPRRRLVLMAIGIHMAIAVWYVIMHQDRYLQAIIPWIAAVTAATLVLAWQRGLVARASLVLLVGFQIVWGADVYFIRTHAMIGDSVVKAAVDFLSAGHEGNYRDRFRYPGLLEDVAPHLPAGTKVLLHEIQVKLGLGAPAITDMPEWQGAFEYLIQDVPSEIERHWRLYGATHVVWMPRKGGPWTADKLAREAVFHRVLEPFLAQSNPVETGSYRVLALPPAGAVTLDSSPTRIAWLGCADDPPSGLYTAAGLEKRTPLAAVASAGPSTPPEAALAKANAVIVRSGCAEWPADKTFLARAGFRHRFDSSPHEVWVRSPHPGS